MMLPSALVELLEALELPLRFEIELSINDEMIDFADSAFVETAVPDPVPEEAEVLPVKAFIRF